MVEPLSAIARQMAEAARQRHNIAVPELTFSEIRLASLVQVSGWDEDFGKAITAALGLLGLQVSDADSLGDYRVARTCGQTTVFRVAPNRLLISGCDCATLDDALAELSPAHAARLDLSHARAVIRVQGAALEDFLARLLPVNIALAAFPPGEFRQTEMHGLSVLVSRQGTDAADIYIPSSFAASALDYMISSARPWRWKVEA